MCFFPHGSCVTVQNGNANTNARRTKMTIDELIERLEDYRDSLGGEAEVRLMTQQNWPFENAIFGLTSGEEINDRDYEDDEEEEDDENVDDDRVVYIVEGNQLGYGSKRAWDAAH